MEYLDFKTAKCKDCFRCLRECPVKAIKFENRQAKIIEEKCILCGKCTTVCPQNAKKVHSELDDVKKLLESGEKTIASVAPSFVSSFGVQSFSVMQIALSKLGFAGAEETAVGANAVTAEYVKLLQTGEFENLISSACPAINHMIQIYYPDALKYLAPVASPMVAHARMLKQKHTDAKIVFIGPCIAKKREAKESGIIDGVLTFEDLQAFFGEKNIEIDKIAAVEAAGHIEPINIAKYYPINNGIIKSFKEKVSGYEFVSVDGVKRSFEVLADINSLSHMFIEINCCEYACIKGPCSLSHEGGALKANEQIRKYVNRGFAGTADEKLLTENVGLSQKYPKISINSYSPCERDIKSILAKTGKTKPEDELNCGACGYSTCREKAVAVLNNQADIEMCIPYMRTRAESMSFEIIQSSPNGIVVMDYDFKITEINDKAHTLLGIASDDIKGKFAFDCFEASDYIIAQNEKRSIHGKKIKIRATNSYAELSIILLPEHKVLFGVYKDITDRVEYDKEVAEIRSKTIATTDEVIKKQMRVAQEIASLLGETTAETKIALLKLKKTLVSEDTDKDGE